MSKYLSQVRVETEFDGDNVVTYMKPLTFGDLMIIDPLLVKLNEARTAFGRASSTADKQALDKEIADVGAQMIAKSYEILPRHILTIEGLYDASGGELGPKQLFESGYFVQLISNLMTELRNRSTPSDPPVPGGQSTDSSPG